VTTAKAAARLIDYLVDNDGTLVSHPGRVEQALDQLVAAGLITIPGTPPPGGYTAAYCVAQAADVLTAGAIAAIADHACLGGEGHAALAEQWRHLAVDIAKNPRLITTSAGDETP
jgi:hypothetical protein